MSILYNITMGTGFPLSINPDSASAGSQLILSTSSIIGYRQWTWVSFPLTNGSILYNPYTNLFAAPSSLVPGAGVVLCNLPINFNFSSNNTWNFGNVSNSNVSDNFEAVRPVAQTGLNLNAEGSSGWGSNTPIIVSSWANGQLNEIWKSTMV
jgi:hypothetical protein